MLDGIVTNSPALIYAKDLDGRYLLANRPFLEAFAVTEQDLLGRDDTWLDAERASARRINDRRARAGAYRLQEWSGSGTEQRAYESVKFPLRDRTGTVYATAGVSSDVTELVRQRERAERAEGFSAAVLAASPDAIVVNDLTTGKAICRSRTAGELLRSGGDLAAKVEDFAAGVHPEDRALLEDALVSCSSLTHDEIVKIRYRVEDASGRQRWLSRRFTSFKRTADGRTIEVLSVLRDITDVVAAEERLSHAALHDVLTGLPNRLLLADRLGGALARAQRVGKDVAVLYCDLDGFKRINDLGGHATGDVVLQQTAQRLQSVLRSQDTVARVGGDEFVVVVEAGRELGLEVARRVITALAVPVVVDGAEHTIGVSVGLAFAGGPGDDRTVEDVLQNADAAMYRAKALGKNRYELVQD